jgi:hypothetical protein
VAEILVEFSDVILKSGGRAYTARVAGAESDNGMWRGWIEFVSSDDGTIVASGRETTQPNREDTFYWATGLTAVYLEGALERTLNSHTAGVRPQTVAATSEPGPSVHAPLTDAVLNPFAAYRKGELMLRRQLQALSSWHLVNIITAHDLSEQDPGDLSASDPEVLIELIVLQVRERLASETSREH